MNIHEGKGSPVNSLAGSDNVVVIKDDFVCFIWFFSS